MEDTSLGLSQPQYKNRGNFLGASFHFHDAGLCSVTLRYFKD